MNTKRFFFLLLMVAIAAILGCSKSEHNPVQPMDDHTQEFLASLSEDSSNIMLGVYDLTFDPDSMNLDMVPSRELSAQLNITSFLFPPNCPDCVTYSVVHYYPTSRILRINLSVKNPTSLIAWNVRSIVYTNNTNLWPTRNETAWTDMFDIPGGNALGINPFYFLNVPGQTNMRFPGFATGTTQMDLHFPGGLWGVQLAFTASYPSMSLEAIRIDEPAWQYEIYEGDSSSNSTYLWVKIWTASTAPVTEMIAFLPHQGLLDDVWKEDEDQGWELWVIPTSNSLNSPAGSYKGLLKVTAGGVNTYKYIDYVIHRDGTILNMYLDDEIVITDGKYISTTTDDEHVYAVYSRKEGTNTIVELHKIRQDGLVLERIANTGYPPFRIFDPAGSVIVDDDFVYVSLWSYEFSFLVFQKKDPFAMISHYEGTHPDTQLLYRSLKDGDRIWLTGSDQVSGRGLFSIDVKNPLNLNLTKHAFKEVPMMDLIKHGDMLFIPASDSSIIGYDTINGGDFFTCYLDDDYNSFRSVATTGNYAIATGKLRNYEDPSPEFELLAIHNPKQWQKVKSFGPALYGGWNSSTRIEISDGYLYGVSVNNELNSATLLVYDLRRGSEFPQFKFQKEFITDYPEFSVYNVFDVSGESLFMKIADYYVDGVRRIEKYNIDWN